MVGRKCPPSYLYMCRSFPRGSYTPCEHVALPQHHRHRPSCGATAAAVAAEETRKNDISVFAREAMSPAACTHPSGFPSCSLFLIFLSRVKRLLLSARRFGPLRTARPAPPSSGACSIRTLCGVLEHGSRVSKYPRGGGPGAGVDCARIRRPSSDVRPSYFNKAVLSAPAPPAVRLCSATDVGVIAAIVVPRPRKFVGPSAGGGR